jgi:hypothetical protein
MYKCLVTTSGKTDELHGGSRLRSNNKKDVGRISYIFGRRSNIVYRQASERPWTIDHGLLTKNGIASSPMLLAMTTRSTSPNPSPPTPRLRRACLQRRGDWRNTHDELRKRNCFIATCLATTLMGHREHPSIHPVFLAGNVDVFRL